MKGKSMTSVRHNSAIKLEGDLFASTLHIVDSAEWVVNLPQAHDARVSQMVVVACRGMSDSTASLSLHQRDDRGIWKRILSTPCFVGIYGLCRDEDHTEGCGKTPLGVYRFNKAFGIAADPGCKLPYLQVTQDSYWSSDQYNHYNELVDIKAVPDLDLKRCEHIADYPYEYQYCLNISFNEAATPGRGSGIFLHCLGSQSPFTEGCIAIPENIMRLVMQNVRQDCVVVIDTAESMKVSF